MSNPQPEEGVCLELTLYLTRQQIEPPFPCLFCHRHRHLEVAWQTSINHACPVSCQSRSESHVRDSSPDCKTCDASEIVGNLPAYRSPIYRAQAWENFSRSGSGHTVGVRFIPGFKDDEPLPVGQTPAWTGTTSEGINSQLHAALWPYVLTGRVQIISRNGVALSMPEFGTVIDRSALGVHVLLDPGRVVAIVQLSDLRPAQETP